MTDFETKDSGQHQEYDSGMRRDSQEGKPRFALMLTKLQPYEEQMLTRYANLLARGAIKYDDRNWEDGDSEEELERAKESLLRHTVQLLAGETDEDHAAAVWFNTQAIEYFRWRIAEKAKKTEFGISFHFDGSASGEHVLAILTGQGDLEQRAFLRGDITTKSTTPSTIFTPAEEAEIDAIADTLEVKTSEDQQDFTLDGSTSDGGFAVFESTESDDEDEYREDVNRWHNRPVFEMTGVASEVKAPEGVEMVDKTRPAPRHAKLGWTPPTKPTLFRFDDVPVNPQERHLDREPGDL